MLPMRTAVTPDESNLVRKSVLPPTFRPQDVSTGAIFQVGAFQVKTQGFGRPGIAGERCRNVRVTNNIHMKQELERDAPEVDVFLGRVISRGLNDPPSFQVPLFGILLRGADTAVGFGQIEEFDLFFPDGASRLRKEDLGGLGSQGDRVAMAILVSRLQGLAGVSREASFRLALWSKKRVWE